MILHFSSSILALALIPLASSLSVQIALKNQFPPVAHVGEFYSWTFSSKTFNLSSSDSTPTFTTSPLPEWLTFNPNNATFYGTPSDTDQSEPEITVTADTGENSVSSTCNILVTSTSAITLNDTISSQFYNGNPSLSSVFVLSNNSALYTGNPALRVPHTWSFSIGFSSETFLNEQDNVHYAVLQTDRSPVPYKMEFSPGPNTLRGTTPTAEEVGPSATLHFDLLGLASDSYTDAFLPFDLVIADHELSIASGSLPTVNITRDANFTMKFGASDYPNVLVDGSPIDPSNISTISIDTSSYGWLEWDNANQVLTGSTMGQDFDSSSRPQLPVTISSTFNQTIHTILPLALEPSFFTTETFPVYSIPESGTVSFDIHPYLSNATGEQPVDVNISIAVEPSSVGPCFNFSSKSMSLEGTITGDCTCSVSNASVTFAAYSNVTHSTSHAILPMTCPSKPASHHPGSLSLAARKKLVLGLCITFGIVGGLSALGTFLASIRRCLRVQDPVMTMEACQRNLSESDKRWYGLVEEKARHGWNHQSTPSQNRERSGMELSRSPKNYGNIGLGLDPLKRSQAKDLMSFSSVAGSNLQSPGVMKKGDFMTRIRETVRNVSDKFGSQSSRKSAPIRRGIIGKPILLNAHEGPIPPSKQNSDPFVTSQDVSAPASVHFADLTRELSTDSMSSTASIRTHANEAVVQTATRHTSMADATPSRPRLKQVTSAMRVPPPKLVTSSPDSEGSTSGSILSARVTSQKAKIWKGTEEDAFISPSTDDMSMGIRYVNALGGDASSDNRLIVDSVSTVDPDARPGSSYTLSTRLQSTYSLATEDHDLSSANSHHDPGRLNRRIIRADERFEIFVSVDSAKKLEARMISGDTTPNWMEFDLRPKNGKIELYGLASIADVGDWDVRIIDKTNGNIVGEIGLQVIPRDRS